MRTNWIAALAGGALLLAASVSVWAIPIRVAAGGVFGEIENEQLVIEPNTPWSIDLTYESTTPDGLPGDPTEGLYNGYLDFQLAIGNQSYTLADLAAGTAGIRILDERQRAGGFVVDSVSFRGALAGTTFGFGLTAVFPSQAPGAGPFQSDVLIDPALLESVFTEVLMPDWQVVSLTFFDLPPGQTTTTRFAVGTVDRFSASAVSVPEPGTLALLAPALLLLVRASRRRLKAESSLMRRR